MNLRTMPHHSAMLYSVFSKGHKAPIDLLEASLNITIGGAKTELLLYMSSWIYL